MTNQDKAGREHEEATREIIRKLPSALDYYEHFSKLPEDGQSFVFGFLYGYNLACSQQQAKA